MVVIMTIQACIRDYFQWDLISERSDNSDLPPRLFYEIRRLPDTYLEAYKDAFEMTLGRWFIWASVWADPDDSVCSDFVATCDATFAGADLTAFRRRGEISFGEFEVSYDAFTNDEAFITYLLMKWA